jgi:hypothetical protein
LTPAAALTGAGFALAGYSNSGKWLELFKEVAPRVTRVAVFPNKARLNLIFPHSAVP